MVTEPVGAGDIAPGTPAAPATEASATPEVMETPVEEAAAVVAPGKDATGDGNAVIPATQLSNSGQNNPMEEKVMNSIKRTRGPNRPKLGQCSDAELEAELVLRRMPPAERAMQAKIDAAEKKVTQLMNSLSPEMRPLLDELSCLSQGDFVPVKKFIKAKGYIAKCKEELDALRGGITDGEIKGESKSQLEA